MAKAQRLLPPIHPGEILRAEFMEPLRLSMNRLALDLRVPVTAFWMNLQSAYDLEVAQDKLSRTIEREVRPASFSAASATS
jgi:plasmid maintenance system antidote protein VapI